MDKTPAHVWERFGNQTQVAKKLGVAKQTISRWKAKKKIPINRVKEIEAITGSPRAEQRPDVFT